jgi:hypothetical protein
LEIHFSWSLAMATDHESNTGLVLALIGARAALAWLLWRRRGARQAGDGAGDLPEVPREVVLRICSGDRVSVNRVDMDLAAAVDVARRAALVGVYARGDARQGWVKDVQAALRAAGVHYRWHPLPYQLGEP